jgi:hypothetical protein
MALEWLKKMFGGKKVAEQKVEVAQEATPLEIVTPEASVETPVENSVEEAVVSEEVK